jgi:hypothetical protein
MSVQCCLRTPSSPVRERERERLNFYACKGAHTLFTIQRGRERERGGKESEKEGEKRVRKRERKGEYGYFNF